MAGGVDALDGAGHPTGTHNAADTCRGCATYTCCATGFIWYSAAPGVHRLVGNEGVVDSFRSLEPAIRIPT